MKTFIAKVVVKLQPNIPDIKGNMVKRAIESFLTVENLICNIGTSYSLQFDATNQIEAYKLVEKIANELLTNNVNEIYEIRSLNET